MHVQMYGNIGNIKSLFSKKVLQYLFISNIVIFVWVMSIKILIWQTILNINLSLI